MDGASGVKLLISNLLYSKNDLAKSIAYTRLLNMGYTPKSIITKAIEFGFMKKGK